MLADTSTPLTDLLCVEGKMKKLILNFAGEKHELKPIKSDEAVVTDKSDLLCCPICKGDVGWCGDHEDAECDGCHYIECKKCGLFDLAVNCGNDEETMTDLRNFCADKWNARTT